MSSLKSAWPGVSSRFSCQPAVGELEHAGGDGDAALALHLHPVGDGAGAAALRLHRAGELDHAAVEQQLLGERRLAGVRVRDDREGPSPADLVCAHGFRGRAGKTAPRTFWGTGARARGSRKITETAPRSTLGSGRGVAPLPRNRYTAPRRHRRSPPTWASGPRRRHAPHTESSRTDRPGTAGSVARGGVPVPPGAPEVSDSPVVTSFAELSLSPASLKALKGAHFERPTPIQARAIPPALQGKDVIGIAATGTGKTAAFLLPILERLAGEARHARALVLAPDPRAGAADRRGAGALRATAAASAARWSSAASAWARSERASARPPTSSSPRRAGCSTTCSRAARSSTGSRCWCSTRPTACSTWASCPTARRDPARASRAQRQTLLFSATMRRRGGRVRPRRTSRIRSGSRWRAAAPPPPAPTQRGLSCARRSEKIAAARSRCSTEDELAHARLHPHQAPRQPRRQGPRAGRPSRSTRIHGNRTPGAAQAGARRLQERQLPGAGGHRHRRARHRRRPTSATWSTSTCRTSPEDYVHRVGRTARAEASGRASTFVAPEEHDLLRDIERLTRAPLPRAEVPRGSEIFTAELKRSAEARGSESQLAAPRARGAPSRPHAARSRPPRRDGGRSGSSRSGSSAPPPGASARPARARARRSGSARGARSGAAGRPRGRR